jgi:hypothetical protein
VAGMFFRRLENNVRQLDNEHLLRLSNIFRRTVLCIFAIRYLADENYAMVSTCLLLEMVSTMIEDYFLEEPGPEFELEPEFEPEFQAKFVGIKFTMLAYKESVIRAIEKYIFQINQTIFHNELGMVLIKRRFQDAIIRAARNTHTFKTKVPIGTIPLAKLILLDNYAFNIDELKNYFARSAFGIEKNPHTKQWFSLYAIDTFREADVPRITAVTPQTLFKPPLRDRIKKQLTIQTTPRNPPNR